jgi:ABC-type sugar transport system substrate-binding protein
MKLTRLKTAMLAACAAMAFTSTAVAADVKATMIIYLDPSVQFFNPVVKGAQDAATQFGVDLDVQYANNDPIRQNDLIESATVSGVDGIAVAISSRTRSMPASAPPSRQASSSSASTMTISKAPRAIAARPMSAWMNSPLVMNLAIA